MAEPKLRREARAIYVEGSLTPSVFHPEWFGARELLREDEVGKATVEVVSAEYAAFELPWLEVEVTPNWFKALASDATTFEALRDLAAATFRILDGLKIEALSLTHHFHYSVEGGPLIDQYVPDALKTFSAAVEVEGLHGEELELRANRPDGDPGGIAIFLQPSRRADSAIYIAFNDYYDWSKKTREASSEALQDTLASAWDSSGKMARDVVSRFLERTPEASERDDH